MTCNVTGTAISPNGQIKPGAKITFRRAQLDVVSQDGSFVIPDDYIIQTALDGTVDFDILPGVYDATTVAVGGRTVAFRVSVPDEPAADFADLLNASYVEIPPASVTQAQQARDDAIAARNSAQAAEAAAELARDEALLYDGPKVDTFAELASVTPLQLAVGEYIRVIATGAVYQRVSSGGDLDYTGSGGVRLAQVGPWKDSGALGLASSVADYLFTQAAAARLRLSTSILSVAQALFVSGRIRGAGNSIAATSSANEIIRALAGSKIEDVDLTASGASVPVGVHVYGSSDLRRLSIDMTGSTASGGRHAVASKSSSVPPSTTPVDSVILHEAVLTAPNGYGVLLNETAPVQRALITSSDVYAQSDAYAFNYPYAAGQHHVLSGLMAHAGLGGTSSNSGFGYSFARVHGFVGSALYSRYSRGEALHIEDGSRFGVIAGSVLRNCQSDGFYGMETGFGNNQAEATPIVNVGFAYEYTGTGAEGPNAAGVYNVWDANGFADHWIHHAGYVSGFPVGLRLEGHGVSIAQDVVVDDATDLIMTAGRHTHFGRMVGRNADTLVRAGSNDARPVIDHVVQVEGVVPGPVFAFPTPSTTIARAVARRITLACECIGSVIAANTTTTVNLRDMPRRCLGTISIIMDLTRGGAAARHRLMGAYPIRFDGTTFTLSDGIRDGDANAAFATTVALQVVGGKLQLRVFSGYTAEAMTVVNCVMDFDGMWIE